MAITCLDTLVGLTDKECPCFDTGRPADYNTSDSGYFLTDEEFGFPIKEAVLASSDCGDESIWTIMEDARSQAIRDFEKTDMPTALLEYYKQSRKGYSGILGKADFSGSFLNIKNVSGLQLQPKKVKYGKFVLKSLYLGVDTTGNVTVNITSNDPDFTPISEVVSATGGRFIKHTLSSPVSFDLDSVFVEQLFYNFSFDTTSITPLKNKIWCCSGKPFAENTDLYGFNADTLDDTEKANEGNGYGLALDGYFTCEKLDWICELNEVGGYNLLSVIARCIQFKGAVKLISKILEGDKVNYYTLLDKEGLYKRRSKLSKLYNDYIDFIAQNVPDNFSDCWKCDDRNEFIVSPILT